MSGREKGVRKILSDQQSKCLYVQGVAEKVDRMFDVLALVRGSSNSNLESSKSRNIYLDVDVEDPVLPPGLEASSLKANSRSVQHLIPMCPTSRLRSDEEFSKLYKKACETGDSLHLEHPPDQRVRKPPAHLEQTKNPTPPVVLTGEESIEKSYFEILDLVMQQISERFQQAGLDHQEALESVLFMSAEGDKISDHDLIEKLALHPSYPPHSSPHSSEHACHAQYIDISDSHHVVAQEVVLGQDQY
ncbi:hypothetical protein FOCC_FOCC012786 [Frankliniella occidentalis]|nr:hypothetical protein FOCC_FOCC012786 [Frankliniella occidentalis]